MNTSDLDSKYKAKVDRRSAFEILKTRAEEAAKEAERLEEQEEEMSVAAREYSSARRYSGSRVGRSSSRPSSRRVGRSSQKSFGEQMTKMVVKELTGTTGRRLVRGILGGLFKGR